MGHSHRRGRTEHLWLLLAGAVIGLGMLVVHGHRHAPIARAAPCLDTTVNEPDELFTPIEPANAGPLVTGPAPIRIAFRMNPGITGLPEGLIASSFDWGDGASTPIASIPCDEPGLYEWPGQTLAHTYASPGTFVVTWRIRFDGQSFDIPFMTVAVQQAAPPTPSPAPTAAAAPTATPPPATPTPAATEAPTATASPTPTSTPSATPTPAPGSNAAAGGTTPGTGTPAASPPGPPATSSDEPAIASNVPEIVTAIRGPEDISTDPGVITTNLVIAGVTVWVLFSSVLLNQVLQDNRSEVERRLAPLARAARPLRTLNTRAASSGGARLAAFLIPAAVLVLTGAIYSLLEPDFGWNRATAVLFVSAVIGVGVVTYLCSGLEVAAIRRETGGEAAVRPYPAAIGVAVVSVGLSRMLNLTPGVMYGYVASSIVLRRGDRPGEHGRVAIVPIAAGLLLSLAAWVAIWPVRSLEGDSLVRAILESVMVVIFIGGIEGLLVSLIPLAATDGGKVFRWSWKVWAGIALLSAFLGWHILLGREREYFSGLREASSLAVLAVFVVYTVATVGLWAYFRFLAAEDEAAEQVPAVETN